MLRKNLVEGLVEESIADFYNNKNAHIDGQN